MDKISMKNILYLSRCSLKNEKADINIIREMDLMNLYRRCEFHMITSIVYHALDKSGIFEEIRNSDDPEKKALIKKWSETSMMAYRKNMLLDAQRNELFGYMEQEGIWHMPLKGVILQHLYPEYGMRQMADNDILYDKAYQDKIKKYMISKGFKVVSVGKSNHDEYQKDPVYNFELHTSLYGSAHKKSWVDYYEGIKENLIQDSNKKFLFHFSDDDFYIYMISHAYKHFEGSGTGIRTLLDIYVYLSKKAEYMNFEYIYNELSKLGVKEFEISCRNIVNNIFETDYCENENTEDEDRMLEYIANSGVHGTLEHLVEKRMNENFEGKKITRISKIKYVLRRIFPGTEHIKMYAPHAYKYKILIPFYYIKRIFKCLISKRELIKTEFDKLGKL